MRSFKIAAFKSPLQAFEQTAPTPAGTEVLLEVLASGVCHTDLHLQEGGYDLGQGRWLSFSDRGIVPPRTPGHEIVGRLSAAGPDADMDLARDRTFLVYPWIGCRTCEACGDGDEHLCAQPRFLGLYRDGGFSDHVLVPHSRYLLDIGDLDPAQIAPYACSGLTTYSALKKAGGAALRRPIVVIGAGGLGLMCVHLLQLMGGAGAIVIDIDERKRAAALQAGARSAIDGGAADALSQLQKALGGPAHVIIDLVGSTSTATLALDALGKGGKLIVVGLYGGSISLALPLVPLRSISITGSFVGNLTELKELLQLVRERGLPPFPIVRRPLTEAESILRDLRKGKVVGRTVMTAETSRSPEG